VPDVEIVEETFMIFWCRMNYGMQSSARLMEYGVMIVFVIGLMKNLELNGVWTLWKYGAT